MTTESHQVSGLPDGPAGGVRRRARGTLSGCGLAHFLHDGFSDVVYVLLPIWSEAFGLSHAGHFALDSCRLEKGYRHWGHDIGPDDTPLEAGLSFAVAWNKPSGFLGRDALLAQRDSGLSRRLLSFAVEDAHPLVLHDEPIYRDGALVGRTTSGGRGFRVGKSLCMGYVACEPMTPKSALLKRPIPRSQSLTAPFNWLKY